METREGLEPHPRFEAKSRFWLRRLNRLFELPDPAEFPPLTLRPTPDELEVISRYLHQTALLTQSEGLNGGSGVHNTVKADGGWEVELISPPYEALTGLAGLFRQLYSTDSHERASFYRVMKVLRRVSADGSKNEKRRIELLGQWSHAVGRLRAKSANALAHERISGAYSDGYPSPDQMIRLFANAELLHWDEKKASTLATHMSSPQREKNLRYRYHEAVAPLAHLFIYFAAFVRKLLEPSGSKTEP
jgi:hypothetical protein